MDDPDPGGTVVTVAIVLRLRTTTTGVELS